MNKTQIRNLVIAVVIAVAGFFGYNVIVTPPINVIPKADTSTIAIDTVKVDTLMAE